MSHLTTRREVLKRSVFSSAGFVAWMSNASPTFSQEANEGELVPFLDEPRTPPNRLDWEVLDSWLTPQDQVFSVQHYGVPKFDYNDYRLEIGGMVKHSKQFTVEQLKALPKKEVVMTLECAGNGSNPGFMNAVCNSRWGGTPLAPLLKDCGIDPAVTEIVFFGEDKQDETLRPGVLAVTGLAPLVAAGPFRTLSVPICCWHMNAMDSRSNIETERQSD